MRSLVAVAPLVIACSVLYAQTAGEGSGLKEQISSSSLPMVKLTFSEIDLSAPLQLPSAVMSGAPTCGQDGRAFFQFRVPPPTYMFSVIDSVSPDGKVSEYPVERIVGLTKAVIVAYDPGISAVSMILRAIRSDQTRKPHVDPYGFYLALFDYDGKFESYSPLDLGFEPGGIAQVTDDTFLIFGSDPAEARARFVLANSDGRVLRDFDETSIMPSEQKLKTMLGSMNFVGVQPQDIPPSMRVGAVLSLLRPVHSQTGILILEPGAGAQVFELERSGETKMVRLRLPKEQIADSLIVGRGKWFVRTYLSGTDDQFNLFEIDPDTGIATRRVDTSGVPATSIACSTDSGFDAFRWIQQKAYMVTSTFR